MEAKLFDRLVSSVKEMDDIVRGERPPSREFHVTPVQVREIRKATGLSQEKFAKVIHVAVGTLKNWEQGHRDPTGPARVLLQVIRHDPKHVIDALDPGSMRGTGNKPRPRLSKPALTPARKRDLYTELETGFTALAASRVSEPTLRTQIGQTKTLRPKAKKSVTASKKLARP